MIKILSFYFQQQTQQIIQPNKKILMALNPQKQSRLGQSKLSSISKLIAYEQFLKEKQQRKTIEEQRKNIELNVANLYRQAKRASKQLMHTQKQLINELNKKSQKQHQQKLKSQYKRLKQQQLNQLKNQNSLSRYMGMLKRQEAKRRLMNQNKQFMIEIRQKQKSYEKIKKQKVVQEKRSIWQKNIMQSNSIKMGIEISRAKSLFAKKSLSSIVKNQLIDIQNQRKQKEKETIQDLSVKKNDLSRIFSKVSQENNKYLNLLRRGKNKSFVEMYDLTVENDNLNEEKRRRKSKRKRKNFSQSRIRQVYFGDQSLK